MAINMQPQAASQTYSSPMQVTSSADVQSQLYMAMMSNLKPEQQAQLQAAMEIQARKLANRMYMTRTIRKLGPALTNGSPTQAYVINTPLTFNLSTSLNGYCEGIIVRVVLNYNLSPGTGATYGLTAAGKLGIIDTVEVRYNKSQLKIRPFDMRQISLEGGLDEWVIPNQVLVGQQDATIQAYLNPAMPTATGAQTTSLEFFIPFNLVNPKDARGVLPLMAGDTGIQVIVNTPVSLLPTATVNNADPLLNAFVWTGGTVPAITAISGTIAVDAVFRDGDTYSTTTKLPFDISLLEGTFQAQLDQILAPLVAGTIQRTKINIMGHHYYVLLKVIDALQANACATQSNIAYIEAAKDGVGGNVFWKYGMQTNLSVYDYQYLSRLGKGQDLDPGNFCFVNEPTDSVGTPFSHLRESFDGYLDNTRTGWADWRYGIQCTAVGTLGSGPRIEPTVFYVNPVGLVPV